MSDFNRDAILEEHAEIDAKNDVKNYLVIGGQVLFVIAVFVGIYFLIINLFSKEEEEEDKNIPEKELTFTKNTGCATLNNKKERVNYSTNKLPTSFNPSNFYELDILLDSSENNYDGFRLNILNNSKKGFHLYTAGDKINTHFTSYGPFGAKINNPLNFNRLNRNQIKLKIKFTKEGLEVFQEGTKMISSASTLSDVSKIEVNVRNNFILKNLCIRNI